MVPNCHKEIKDEPLVNEFKQVIQSPARTTKNTKTLIGIFATTDKAKVSKTIVHSNSFSDHYLTGIVRKMHVQKFAPRTILSQNLSKYSKEAFRHDLQNIDWVEVLQAGKSNLDINTGLYLIKQKLTAVIDLHAPLVEIRIRGRDCAWLTKK